MRIAVVGAALVLAAGAACGGGTKVGKDVRLGTSSGPGCRLGECTTTTAPTGTTAPPVTARSTPSSLATSTTRPKATTTTAQAVFVVKIQNENASTGAFDPTVASVHKGTQVRWVNSDTVARSVEFDDGSVKSGPIPPNGSFAWTAAAAGTFNYHDGTRPYAVASVEVRA